jgi:pimeloyl-ACP methyl ester carboxylesterase
MQNHDFTSSNESVALARPAHRPRWSAAAGLAAVVMLAAGAGCAGQALAGDSTSELRTPPLAGDVLLVHGAWADGSSWSEVIERLQRDGYAVRAVQLPLQSLAGDAAIVRAEIARIGRPVVVAGHSYGGAVIGEGAGGASNVVGLVFAAAYALDEGESLGALNARFPATPIVQSLVFDTTGNATVEPQAFVRLFAPDVPRRQAQVLAAVQKPISGAVFGAVASAPAWKTVPSWYQVSRDDQVISPELQRSVAARMGARVIELSSSHASPISHPREIAELIERASRGR